MKEKILELVEKHQRNNIWEAGIKFLARKEILLTSTINICQIDINVKHADVIIILWVLFGYETNVIYQKIIMYHFWISFHVLSQM